MKEKTSKNSKVINYNEKMQDFGEPRIFFHRQRNSAAYERTMLAQPGHFHTRALRIQGVVVETSKRAHSIGNWSGLCPF
jgi:hypothetical protein